ncbi:MAG: hypothetical protein QOF72_2506, partial [Blastocatellia bacterium]|nr:hypothetical protein [Blastocatellia bacterium]
AAHLADAVVKSDAAVTTLSDLPSEYFFVKGYRARDVDRRNLDVANLAISKCGLVIFQMVSPAISNWHNLPQINATARES